MGILKNNSINQRLLKESMYWGNIEDINITNNHDLYNEGVIVKDSEIELLASPLFEEYLKSTERKPESIKGLSESELFINTGYYIEVLRKRKITKPLIINLTNNTERVVINEKNTILVGEDSSVTIIFDYTGDDEMEAIRNMVTEVYVEDKGVVNIIKLQRQNDLSLSFDYNNAEVFGKGRVNWYTVELGSSSSFSSFYTELKGHGSKAFLSSIYFADQEKKFDLNYTMEHTGRDSFSRIDSRGVLKDRANKIFRGKLKFNKGAVKASGSEKESVLLLSPSARSQVIPALFCEEEDVSGEHAASAGRVSENQLYYLMSRGLSLVEARRILVESALNPLIEEIPLEDLRGIIRGEVEKRLYNE